MQKAYSMDDADPAVREALSEQLQHHIMQQEPSGCEMEGLFLKLVLKEEAELSSEVLSKLSLDARHLSMASPEQLMLLAHQLGNHDRKADGSAVAVVAATALASNDRARQSEEAFLRAFALDQSNQDAGKGLAQAVSSAHERCEELENKGLHWEERCNVLGAECKEFKESCEDLRAKCGELKESNEEMKATCQALRKNCEELKAKADMPRVELDSPIVWDLSTFSVNKTSPTFQLPGGVEASLNILPPCGFFNYSCLLHVNKDVHIKGTLEWDGHQAEAFDVTVKAQSSATMTIAQFRTPERPKSVTLRILSVQREGSELRFG